VFSLKPKYIFYLKCTHIFLIHLFQLDFLVFDLSLRTCPVVGEMYHSDNVRYDYASTIIQLKFSKLKAPQQF